MLTSSAGACRDYWARFERFVNLLTRTCDDVYVLTGPLFLPSKTPLGYMMQHPMIGARPTPSSPMLVELVGILLTISCNMFHIRTV